MAIDWWPHACAPQARAEHDHPTHQEAEPRWTMQQLAALVILATVAAAQPQGAASNISVQVYYESLCPDSVNFINNELFPTWLNLAHVFSVDWLPYGKAMHKRRDNGSYTFRCQHGSLECRGNMIQACALSVLSPANATRWIHCVMSSPAPHNAVRRCSSSLQVDYLPIEQCALSERGSELLAAFGDRTHALQPRLTFVPTITFNGVYDANLQSRSLRDFKGVICELAATASEAPPEACRTT